MDELKHYYKTMKHISLILMTLCVFSNAWAFKQKEITAVILSETTMSWNGSTLPSYPDGQPEITILKVTIPPKTELQWHKHPIINAGYIVSGKMKVETETNDVLYLNAGDTIVELIDTWHRGVNETRKPVELIVFYAGIVGTPLTILKD
jgi:quercetin dioxygenase-like cupin family protein